MYVICLINTRFYVEEVSDDTEGLKAAEGSVAARKKNQLFSRKLFW